MFNKYNHLMSEQSKGVSASILCSLLFALIPAYVQLQPDMAPSLIAGGDSHWLAVQRIFWSTLLFGALLLLTKRLPLLIEALKARKQWGRYLLSAILVAPQYWLFVWAPANGETLNLALGYFTLPIVMVLVGRFVYQESLTRLQKVACLFALLGTIWLTHFHPVSLGWFWLLRWVTRSILSTANQFHWQPMLAWRLTILSCCPLPSRACSSSTQPNTSYIYQ
ncbi:chloramphenicol-sensitive protein RarD [Vibrio ponticus]|nr:chloramphenicol-sensitive protein RarD [Vibrio ponticus]